MSAPFSVTAGSLQGQTVAFLFDKNRARLLALATRMVSSNEAEDVVQDAFVNTLRHCDQFRGQSQPSTWLYRVTVNAALMRLRTRRRKGAESLDALPNDVAEACLTRCSEVRGSPLDDAELAETRGAINDAVASLRPIDRRIVQLRFVDGLSTEEVATATSMTVAAVKTRLHRARSILRQQLVRDERSRPRLAS